MAFMVLNTGRTASRAFYLNLKRQRSVLSVSRTYLDAAISRFMSKGDSSSLVRVEGILKALRGHACGNTAFGTVFHGVRPLLAYPFSDERNREVLKALRDRWGIRTVFFPIRDPRDVFLSSMNRSLAHAAGDWRFPPDVFGWKNQFSFDELSNGAATGSEDRSSPKGDPGLLHKIAVHISERTGRLHSLYELFSAVFDEIYLVDYRKLLEDPEAIYRGIAEVGGFSFDDTTLLRRPWWFADGTVRQTLLHGVSRPVPADLLRPAA